MHTFKELKSARPDTDMSLAVVEMGQTGELDAQHAAEAARVILSIRESPDPSDHPQSGRSHWLLLLSIGRNASILRNPRRSVSVGREAVCFLDKFAKACDPDFVDLSVLEDLVRRVAHWLAPCSGMVQKPQAASR
jgi:hypothetical protein